MDASIGMCAFSTCDSVRPRRESFDRVVAVAVNSQASKPSAPVQKKSVSKSTSAPKVETAATTNSTAELCAWFKCTKGPNGLQNLGHDRNTAVKLVQTLPLDIDKIRVKARKTIDLKPI